MEISLTFVILLVFYTVFASAYIDWAVDCGSSESYTDDNGITWRGDDDLISTGQSHVVPNGNSVDQVLSTLRAFTSRKRNCYSLSVSQGEQVLIRAHFYYGNYDKSSSPPTFDLQFDGNHWTTVETKLDQSVSYETIYVTKFDYVSVCLAQTQANQFPFISALEVSILESDMYHEIDGAKSALYLMSRLGYGLTNVVRYSDDDYDRIWTPEAAGDGLQVLKSDTEIDTSVVYDKPPSAVMQTAITTTNTSTYITHSFDLPLSSPIPIYVNFYFAELMSLATTDKRSFQLYVNDKPYSGIGSIAPPYGSAGEITINDIVASSNFSFSLVATSDSTLPPLINALELFQISDPLTNGTYTNDVEALIGLQNQFPSLQDWSSDPCLPSSYSWEWINCTSDPTPRVTALFLSGYNLSEVLPDFSSMTALVTIDLHNNSLIGEIPEFLGLFPNLKELNLADNLFIGAIPSSISSNKNIKLTVTGNPNLCTSGKNCKTSSTSVDSSGSSSSSSGSKKNSKLPVILGTVIPVFAAFWIILGAVVTMQQRRKRAAINALTAGQPQGGGTTPMLNNQQLGIGDKFGQVVMNEFRVEVQEQVGNENSNPDGENGKDQN